MPWVIRPSTKDNELQIRHGLSKNVKFSLKHVEFAHGCKRFVKVGDLRELIHVLTNIADDLKIIDALIAHPFPDHQEFAMRTLFGIVESSGTTV